MSAYDNPKLINDKSALAWAAAAQQVTQAVVTGYQNYVDFKTVGLFQNNHVLSTIKRKKRPDNS